MGSWNMTCGLSGLPIKWKDKAYAIILIEVEDKADIFSFTHPKNSWHPIMFPFLGTYDMYGTLEKIKEDENTKGILDYFNSKLPKGLVVDEKRNKHLVNGKFKSIGTLLKAIERRDVQHYGYMGQLTNVHYMMILKDVYDSTIVLSHDYFKNNAFGPERVLKDDGYSDWQSTENIMAKMMQTTPKKACLALESFRRDGGYHYVPQEFHYDASKFIEEKAVENIYLTYLMKVLGKSYAPQTTVNDADLDYDIHLRFNRRVTQIGEKLSEKWEDECNQ